MQTPTQFAEKTLMAHEGGLSLDPDDNGNWFDQDRYRRGLPQQRNHGKLIGSKFGVTPAVLARYWKVDNVTREQMRDLDKATAVEVALMLYYREPGYDRLQWNRVTVSVVDMAYNAGTSRTSRMLQQLIGVTADGQIGPKTARAFAEFILKHGEAPAAQLWCKAREQKYAELAVGKNAKYLRGWTNRARSFLPNTAWWVEAGK